MKSIKINYDKNIELGEWKKLISFMSKEIVKFELGEDAVEIFYNDGIEEAVLMDKYDKIISHYCTAKGQEEFYYQSEKTRYAFVSPEEIQKAELIKKFGDGLIGLRKESMLLFEYFAEAFRKLAMEEGAEERMYPTLLDTTAYQKTGYFKSSPQYVTFCCDVMEDINSIERLDEEFQSKNVIGVLSEPRYALSPSACFHTYMEYEGQELETCKTITFEQKVFRNEGRFNWGEFGRLRDYHVREIVFIGDITYVKEKRDKIMERTASLLTQLGLEGNIVSSSDPFIAPQMQKFKKLQLHQKNKYEVRIQTGENSDIACASFNLHGVSFTKPFHIKVQAIQQPVTGCIGFGLERWVLAFLAQYGMQKEYWPESVIKFLREKELNHD